MIPALQTAYERSPAFLQHAMISAYGWKLKRLRYGGNYSRYLDQLSRTQYYSAAELAELQNERLERLIRHCYENVPYYGRLMRDLRLTPADFKKAEDLRKLPVLEKETVRAEPRLFYASNYLGRPCEIVNTSGTTGATLRIRVDVEGRRENYAFFGRLKAWAGIDPGARTAVFAGRTLIPISSHKAPFWRYNFAVNTLLFSSYHLSDKNIPIYLEKLLAWNPQLIDSYPSSISMLARYVHDHRAAAPKPTAIITSSETLFEEQRNLIERAFRTRVFDQYGAAEQAAFISQCQDGTYHIHPEFGIMEFVKDDSPDAMPGSKIIATGFTNWAMPLVRYETGDMAVPSERPCTCGRNFPALEQILGRVDDLILTPDGRRVGRLDPIFKGLESVRQAQIVQETVHTVRIRIVPGKGFLPAHRESLLRELERRVGTEVNYTFEIVDHIPVGPGGKFRAVISKVAQDQLLQPATSAR